MFPSDSDGSVTAEPIDSTPVNAPDPVKDGAKFQFFSGPDYLALPREPQPWLIKDLLPLGGLANLYGKPKTRKSFLALQMGEAITNRATQKWEGFDVAVHGPVAYLQIDTPRSDWSDRVDKLTAGGYDFSQMFFADMNTVTYPVNIIDPKQVAGLTQALRQLRPVLTVIDTLRESFSGDENDSNTMRQVVTNLVAAARPSAILLLSHQRKDGLMKGGGEDSLLMDDNRGSGYISGRMDVIMRLTERTLTFQGRSVGQKQLPVVHHPTLHTVHIAEHKKEQDRIVGEALKTQGGTSEREMVKVLVGSSAERVNDPLYGLFTGHSESTVRKWLQAARKS